MSISSATFLHYRTLKLLTIFFLRLGFDARDTRWVGAWWIGFLISAVAFVVFSIPVFGYPKYMPGIDIKVFHTSPGCHIPFV